MRHDGRAAARYYLNSRPSVIGRGRMKGTVDLPAPVDLHDACIRRLLLSG